jgi:adhesin HecA-like repeat protein
VKFNYRGNVSTRLAFILTAAVAASPAMGAAILSVTPASLPVVGAESFSLNISISGVTDLFGYQFDLGFNPAVLSVTGESEGPFLATGGSTFFIPGSIDNVGGTVSATADTLLTAISGVSGSGILATIDFSSIGNGASSITLFNVFVLDSTESEIPATIQNGTVAVNGIPASGVPEPSSGFLLGAGLLLGWFLRVWRGPQRRLPDLR